MMLLARLAGLESPESSTSSIIGPPPPEPFPSSAGSSPFFSISTLSFFFFDLFLGGSHSHRGINYSTWRAGAQHWTPIERNQVHSQIQRLQTTLEISRFPDWPPRR